MQKDPLSLLGSFVSVLFKKNILIIAVLVGLLIVATMVISKTVTEIAPIVQQAIGSTTDLVEKINETQEGFTVAMQRVGEVQAGFRSVLEQVDGMSGTIARIERIINRIPDRLLRDEETGEWEVLSILDLEELIETLESTENIDNAEDATEITLLEPIKLTPESELYFRARIMALLQELAEQFVNEEDMSENPKGVSSPVVPAVEPQVLQPQQIQNVQPRQRLFRR